MNEQERRRNQRQQLLNAERSAELQADAWKKHIERMERAGVVVTNIHDEWSLEYPKGCDFHLMTAAIALDTTYVELKVRFDAREPEAVRARMQAKEENFMTRSLRGLGPSSLVDYSRGQAGGPMTNEEAQELVDEFKNGLPEVMGWLKGTKPNLQNLKRVRDRTPDKKLTGVRTGRTRSDRPNESNKPRVFVGVDYSELEQRTLSTLESMRERGITVDRSVVNSLRSTRDPEEQRMDAQDTLQGMSKGRDDG